jgi:hypothetical protein
MVLYLFHASIQHSRLSGITKKRLGKEFFHKRVQTPIHNMDSTRSPQTCSRISLSSRFTPQSSSRGPGSVLLQSRSRSLFLSFKYVHVSSSVIFVLMTEKGGEG